jgi:dimethylargininase
MQVALTRPVPASLARCELTHLERTPIDAGKAAAEHRRYEEVLGTLGCTVRRVPPADDLPDSVFIEDVAVVLDEVAIITRPGAASRRPERAAVAAILSEYRPLESISAPATLDGGDVLRLERTLYVGLSSRTNVEGARQLARLTAGFGYSVVSVRTARSLHLKSAVTALDLGHVLCNPAWIESGVFRDAGIEVLEVDASEPHAANVLWIGESLVCAASHVRTAADLRARGYDLHTVEVAELAKAEAGVTCCSLIIEGV